MGYLKHYSKWHNHKDPNYVTSIKRKFIRAFGEYLPDDKDAPILEIGCSNGMALLALRDLGYVNLLGIEIDEELGRIAQSFSLPVLIQDATEFIKSTDRRFDFIYMFDVLEHFEPDKISSVLSDLFRLLNQDGKLMLIVPNATSPAGSYFRYIDWTHKVSFTPTSISYLLEEVGFKEIIIADESLIEVPVREDYHDDASFERAKRMSERARFFEAFARWEMVSMFGPSPYNMLVAPNMKIVAFKRNQDKTNLQIKIEKNSLFDLQALSNQVASNNLGLEELKKSLTEIQKSLNCRFSELINESQKIKEEIGKELGKLEDKISQKIENIVYDQQSIISNTHKVEQSLFNFYKGILRKKRKRLWWKVYYKFKAYRLRKLVLKSGLFDQEYYLQNNPDVKETGMDPILHYLLFGAYEGRNPSKDFDTDEYIKSHPEIVVENMNPIVHRIVGNNRRQS